MIHRALIASACVALLALACPAQASASDPWRVGARAGLNLSRLSQPTDPVGEPTLLYGSAFSGVGWAAGLGITAPLSDMSFGLLAIRLDALYSRHHAEGFAADSAQQQRQSITLDAHLLRVPALLRAELALSQALALHVGAGPELLWVFASGSTTTHENLSAPPPPLPTANTTHVGLTFELGVSILLSDALSLPVTLRVSWDPMVQGSTRERFEGFQSLERPGRYQVAYDLQALLLTGVDFDL